MQTFIKIMGIACLLFVAWWGMRPVRLPSIAGQYEYAHRIVVPPASEHGDWQEQEASDELTIRRDSGDELDFNISLAFSGFHSCALEGIAMQAPAREGKRVYHYQEKAPVLPDSPCSLDLLVGVNSIQLSDPEHSCRAWCGARGQFDGAQFPRSSRKPLN